MKTERLLASCCHRQNRLGHGVSPCRLLFPLLPCAVALLPAWSLQGPTGYFCSELLLFPLGSQGCFSHSGSPSLIADGVCFALSEQMLSLRHCCRGGEAQLNPAVAALELSGSGCGHCLAALGAPHTALPAAPATVWAAALHKTSAGSHYIWIFLFWNNTKYGVLKFSPANTEGRCTEV